MLVWAVYRLESQVTWLSRWTCKKYNPWSHDISNSILPTTYAIIRGIVCHHYDMVIATRRMMNTHWQLCCHVQLGGGRRKKRDSTNLLYYEDRPKCDKEIFFKKTIGSTQITSLISRRGENIKAAIYAIDDIIVNVSTGNDAKKIR